MKILLISDIHGNFPALDAVTRHAGATSCDMIFNCGDSTVYAPFANQALNWLKKHNAVSILGNTDAKVVKLLKGKTFKKPSKAEKRIMYTSTVDILTPQSEKFLLDLKKKKKLKIKGITVGLFHGSPENFDEFLFFDTPDIRFREIAEKTDCDIVITGHSHSPYHKHINGVHFINPGSVGRMFDANPNASYAILEMKNDTIRVRHFRCPYDIELVVKGIRAHHLPPIYEEMYRVGRKLN